MTLLIYAAIMMPLMVWLTMSLWRGLQGFQAREHATCGGCGYALTGLDAGAGIAACPECGAAMQDVGIVGRKQYTGPSASTWIGLWTLLAGPTVYAIFVVSMINGPRLVTVEDEMWLGPLNDAGQRMSRPFIVQVISPPQAMSWKWPGAPRQPMGQLRGREDDMNLELEIGSLAKDSSQGVDITLRASRRAQGVPPLTVMLDGQVVTDKTRVQTWLIAASGMSLDDAVFAERVETFGTELLKAGPGQAKVALHGWDSRPGNTTFQQKTPVLYVVFLALGLLSLFGTGPLLYLRARRRAGI